MVGDSGNVDLDTRTALATAARRTSSLLRACASALSTTRLIEDGSASGVVGEVRGASSTPRFAVTQTARWRASARCGRRRRRPRRSHKPRCGADGKSDSKPALKITPAR
jgi:hypothetical protein